MSLCVSKYLKFHLQINEIQWTESLQDHFIAFLEAMAFLPLILTPANIHIYVRYFRKSVILDISQTQMYRQNAKQLLFSPMTLDTNILKLYFQQQLHT